MLINLENNFACATEASDAELDWLRELLSISEPTFRKNWQTGRVERAGMQKTILIRPSGKFPAGFARLIWKEAKEKGFEVRINDLRKKPDAPIQIAGADYLRDYQREAIEAFLRRTRGVIHHATGAGKTVVAVALVESVPIRWLFLVQQKDLLHQTAKVYRERTGKEPNLIGDGRAEIKPGAVFTIATVQTLNARRNDTALWEHIASAEGLIVDECHASPAKTMWRVIMHTPNAYFRCGLSGTPYDRSDKRGLLTIGALGPTVHRVTADSLVQQGFLSKASISMHEFVQDSKRTTFQGVYGELVVRSNQRNQLLADLMLQAPKPNLTFVKEIAHGQYLADRASRRGLRVEFVWGDKSSEERLAAIERLVRSDIDCIVSSSIFTQGVDIPQLRSIVIGSSGRSVIQTLQRIGRGMRISEGKTTFEVHDIYDAGNKWLHNHAKQRQKAYEREGHKVKIVKTQLELKEI